MFRQRCFRSYHPFVEALEARCVPSFLPPVLYTVGLPAAEAVADFNNDNVLDLAVTNGAGGVNIFLGNGDGTFQSPVSFPAGNETRGVAVGDFNGDGNLDLAVTDFGINSSTLGVSVLVGNGDGTFQPPIFYPLSGVGRPYAIAIADFNNDGNLDLAIGNLDGAPLSVLLGNGDGTFQAPVNYGGVSYASSLAVADLKGDGNMDIVASNPFGNTLTVYYGDGTGVFPTIQNFSVSDPNGVAVGDVNGDGIPDLVAADGSDNQVAVLLGKGDGTFQSPTGYSVGAGKDPLSIVLADFDGDGNLDAATINLFTNNGSVLLGNGDGSFQSGQTYSVGANDPESLAVGDFNGDGFPDLVTGNYLSNSISVLINAADWGSVAPGPRHDSGRPGRDQSSAGLLAENSLSAGSLGQDPEAVPQPILTFTGREQQPVQQQPMAADSGGPSEPESQSLPTSVGTRRHAPDAMLEPWVDPALDVLALNLLR